MITTSDLIEILKTVIVPTVLFYIGYNEKDKISMKHDARAVETKVYSLVPREDIERLIDLKLESSHIQIAEMKDDLKRIEIKLDRIIDKLSK